MFFKVPFQLKPLYNAMLVEKPSAWKGRDQDNSGRNKHGKTDRLGYKRQMSKQVNTLCPCPLSDQLSLTYPGVLPYH